MGKTWTLKVSYTGFVSLWKLQVLFSIRSETCEIILEFVSSPSQKITFSNNVNLRNINLRFLSSYIYCAFSSYFRNRWLMALFLRYTIIRSSWTYLIFFAFIKATLKQYLPCLPRMSFHYGCLSLLLSKTIIILFGTSKVHRLTWILPTKYLRLSGLWS